MASVHQILNEESCFSSKDFNCFCHGNKINVNVTFWKLTYVIEAMAHSKMHLRKRLTENVKAVM